MKKPAWFIVLLVLSIKPVAAGSETHCAETEKIFFSCPLAQSQKVVSLCGGSSGSDRVSWVQYRFGKIGQPEMIFPTNMDGSLDKFSGVQQTAKAIGLEIREVWFRNGRFSYLIEHISGGDRDPSAPSEDNDLVVFRDGRDFVAKFSCTKPVVNRLFELDGHISDDQSGRPG
jgi:hypothetical protein